MHSKRHIIETRIAADSPIPPLRSNFRQIISTDITAQLALVAILRSDALVLHLEQQPGLHAASRGLTTLGPGEVRYLAMRNLKKVGMACWERAMLTPQRTRLSTFHIRSDSRYHNHMTAVTTETTLPTNTEPCQACIGAVCSESLHSVQPPPLQSHNLPAYCMTA